MKSLNILFLSASSVTSSKADSFKNLSRTCKIRQTNTQWHEQREATACYFNLQLQFLRNKLQLKAEVVAGVTVLTFSHAVSGSSGGVACFSMFLKAASFLFIFLASSFSRSLSLASAFSSNYIEQDCKNKP